jgi:N-formylglutamate amidohydrolase
MKPVGPAGACVFSSPHSGRNYPKAFVAASKLDPLTLRRSEDVAIHELYAAAPAFGCPLLAAEFPRAFVDPNRQPFELDPSMFSAPLPDYAVTRTARLQAGLGTIAKVVADQLEIYRGPLLFDEVADRIAAFHQPYHVALKGLLEEARDTHGHAVLVDCHSMPSVGSALHADEGQRRADVILGDRFGTSCAPGLIDAVERTFQALGYRVVRNQPYAGGFITEHYGQPAKGVHVLQIELNRGLYLDEVRLEKKAGFDRLATHLEDVIAAAAAWSRNPA